jgi:uncharacterized RDD family membrane protein YckC
MEGLASAATGPQLDGRRALAALIDMLLLVGVGFAVGVAFGDLGPGLPALALAWSLYYYFAFESSGGQTPGKRLMGLRVVRADGSRVGMREVAVRTVLRVVDGIGLYLVGLVVMLVTGKRRQRLGDLAAGTVVTTAKAPAQAAPAVVPEPAPASPPPLAAVPEPEASTVAPDADPPVLPDADPPAASLPPGIGTPLPGTAEAPPSVPELRDFPSFEAPAPAPEEAAEELVEEPSDQQAALEVVPIQEAPVEEASLEDAPVAEAPVEVEPVAEAPVADAPAEAPVEEAAAVDSPVEDDAPAVEDAAAVEAPVEEAPLEEVPAVEDTAPVEAPAEEAASEEAPAQEEAPPEEAPVDEAPAADAPAEDPQPEEDPRDELLRAVREGGSREDSEEGARVKPSRLEIVSNPIELVMGGDEPADDPTPDPDDSGSAGAGDVEPGDGGDAA